MNSLRWKLVAGILTGITFVLALGGTCAFLEIRSRLYADFDQNLFQRATALKFSVQQDKGRIAVGRLDKPANLLGHEPGIDYFHVYQKDTEKLVVSSEGAETPLPKFGGPLDKPEFREVMLPGGKHGRSVGIEFNARVELTKKQKAARIASGETSEPIGPLFQLVLAKVDGVAPILATIQRWLFGLWAGCSVSSGILIWCVVYQSLRPLDQLKSRIEELRDSLSGQRIALDRPPTELRPVVNELNRL